jgi:glyoxylase-like metal-dependent hydrolase (beta-lactamase superfamily II)
MEYIEIPRDEIIELNDVAADVRGLRITFVNVFGITHADGSWTLIDSALPMSAGLIRSWAKAHFSGPPKAIVLSHGHFDHVSEAVTLADEWQVPIYAHPAEGPYLTGQRKYPAPNPGAGGGMMSYLSPLLPKGPVDLSGRLRLLPETSDESFRLDELPGWQILHTPGHTPGHISFFRAGDRVLLPADAFCTTKPESFFKAAISQPGELHGPPSYFTADWNLAKASVQYLSSLDPLVIAPGHGRPISGPDVGSALKELASRFDEVAVPDNRQSSVA